jgi:hypothetical protein
MEQDRIMSRDQAEHKKPSQAFKEKRVFIDRLEMIISQCSGKQEFKKLLDYHSIAYKFTAKNVTLTNPDATYKKNIHRIKTLGLQDLYDQMLLRGEGSISIPHRAEIIERDLGLKKPEPMPGIEPLEP